MNRILLQEAEETTHDKGQRTWCSFWWLSLPALAFPSASLSSSRESERAGQHHAAQTLDKQKKQPQSALWTAPSTDFPQMAKEDLLSPIRSSLLVPCHSLPGTELRLETSCNVSVWPEQAVEKDGRAWVHHCTTQCKSHILVTRHRAKSTPNTYRRIGLRYLIELRVAFIWVLLRNNTGKILFSFSPSLLHRHVYPIPSLRL